MFGFFRRKSRGKSSAFRKIDLTASPVAPSRPLPRGRIVTCGGEVSERIASALDQRLRSKRLCDVTDVLIVPTSQPDLNPLRIALDTDVKRQEEKGTASPAEFAVMFTCELTGNTDLPSLVVEKVCLDLSHGDEFGHDNFRIDPQSGHRTTDELVERASYLIADLCSKAMMEMAA